MSAETITITILSSGVAFQNGDETRRLKELGFTGKGKTKLRSVPHSQLQTHVIGKLKKRGIRDLDHYREVVGNPRSNGPMLSFMRGQVLTMILCDFPGSADVRWYVILDTAIGCSEAFMKVLTKHRRVRIEKP